MLSTLLPALRETVDKETMPEARARLASAIIDALIGGMAEARGLLAPAAYDPGLLPAGLAGAEIPLSLPGVIAGTLLTFIPAAGDYVNAALLGRPSNTMIGNRIEYTFLSVNDYPTAAVLSFILMVTILILVLIYVRKVGTEDLV